MTDETIQADQGFARTIIEEGAATLNNCIQCGTCTGSCPSGRHAAMRIRKLIRAGQLGVRSILDSNDLWLCTTCYCCFERCPNEVDVPHIIMVIRNMAAREGLLSDTHRRAAKRFFEVGHLVPLSDEFAQMREEMGLERNPDTSQFDEKTLKDLKKLLTILHFDDYFGGD
jgi:heterodisulfide reductase subunit C